MIYKRGSRYSYRFMWKGKLIRQSTGQGNDKIARNMESAHRARLALLGKEQDAVRERLNCADVLACHECEKLFNADKAVRKQSNVFCTPKCAAQWGKVRSMPSLEKFLEDRFIPDSKTRHKAKLATVRYYQQGSDMLIRSRCAQSRLCLGSNRQAGKDRTGKG